MPVNNWNSKRKSKEQQRPSRSRKCSWNSIQGTRTSPEAPELWQACLHCSSLVRLFICTTWTPLPFRTENWCSQIQMEIIRKNTMAVHIFRAGLTGKLLFPEEILFYINFRSTAIYLLKKPKQFISLWAGMENRNIQKAGKYHYTWQTSKAQRQEE